MIRVQSRLHYHQVKVRISPRVTVCARPEENDLLGVDLGHDHLHDLVQLHGNSRIHGDSSWQTLVAVPGPIIQPLARHRTDTRSIARGLEVGGTTCGRPPDPALPASPFPFVKPSPRIPPPAFRSIACLRPPKAAARTPKRSKLHSLANVLLGKGTDSPDYALSFRRSPSCSCHLIGCSSTSALAGPACRRRK